MASVGIQAPERLAFSHALYAIYNPGTQNNRQRKEQGMFWGGKIALTWPDTSWAGTAVLTSEM